MEDIKKPQAQYLNSKHVTDYRLNHRHPYLVRFLKEFGVYNQWMNYTKTKDYKYLANSPGIFKKLIDVVQCVNFTSYIEKHSKGVETIFNYFFTSTLFRYYLLVMHSNELESGALLYKNSLPVTTRMVKEIQPLLELGKMEEEIKEEVNENMSKFLG